MGLQIVFMAAHDAGDFGLSDLNSPPEATAALFAFSAVRGVPGATGREAYRDLTPCPAGELNVAALSY